MSLHTCVSNYICSMAKDTTQSKRLINLRVDPELAEAGKALAKKRGANLSTLLRMLLIQELENDKASTK
jgi:predicted DNA binding CopG/RHH family protein